MGIKCFIPNCEDIGIIPITDATNNPSKYNGMLLCRSHFEERKYMQDTEQFEESNPSSQQIQSKELFID